MCKKWFDEVRCVMKRLRRLRDEMSCLMSDFLLFLLCFSHTGLRLPTKDETVETK
jgi:hypothetical protein